jgi:hypothetical protein
MFLLLEAAPKRFFYLMVPFLTSLWVSLRFNLFRHAGLDPASRGFCKDWIPAGVYPVIDTGLE